MMRPEIVVPAVMGCALLWWIGRDMKRTTRLIVAAVTLVIVGVVISIERSMSQ
jgi:hypothetical protein